MAKYGLQLVVGSFGSGKSLFTHWEVTTWWQRKAIRIGNYTSPDFHLQFRSVNDLVLILKQINDHLKDRKNIGKKITIVIDEGALYFGNREFKTFPKQVLSFMVQLRKLGVECIIIAQDLKMLDITFRRLCYNVKKYYYGFGFLRFSRDFELLSEDANINDPINTIASRPYFAFWPTIRIWFFSVLTAISNLPLMNWLADFIPSSRYDTKELILADYDILDVEKLQRLFPKTIIIESSEDYALFMKQKEKEFFDNLAIELKNNKRRLRYYEKIYNYSTL